MGGVAVLVARGLGAIEGRAVWYILTTDGDKDGATSVAEGGVTWVANGDPVSGFLKIVSSTFWVRDSPCCEISAVAGTVSVGTCNWLTSM